MGHPLRVVQQNAANAEESASAAQTMNSQAQNLKGFVDKLGTMVGGAMSGPGVKKSQPAAVKCTKAVPTQVVHRPKAAPSLPAAKEVKPEQLIPLEGQEGDFKDF